MSTHYKILQGKKESLESGKAAMDMLQTSHIHAYFNLLSAH